MSTSLRSEADLKTINITGVVIGLMLLLSLLTGVLPQQLLSFAIVALCAVLFFRDELYLAYPFVLFYNEMYGTIFGMSVSRILSLMLLALFCIKLLKGISIKNNYLAPVVVYVMYALFVVTQYSVQQAIFSIIDIVCCIFLVVQYLRDNPENVRKFFGVYIFVSLIACVTGVLLDNVYIQSGTMPRFLATFEDPNYMGYFYTIGAFGLVSLKLFSPRVRYVLLVIIYGVVVSSLSLSALVVNILIWLVYLVVTRNINLKSFVTCIILLFGALLVYKYGLDHPNTSILGQLSIRVEDMLSDILVGDINDATTGRINYAAEHLKYFLDQPFWSLLFGGTAVNTQFISYPFSALAHNEYVDMLLNVGLLGTAILLSFTIYNLISSFKKFIETDNNHYLFIFMIKCIWFSYCLTLTVFMDYRFMMPFFM